MEPDSRTKSEREFRESVWLCKTRGNKPVECFSQGGQTRGMFIPFCGVSVPGSALDGLSRL